MKFSTVLLVLSLILLDSAYSLPVEDKREANRERQLTKRSRLPAFDNMDDLIHGLQRDKRSDNSTQSAPIPTTVPTSTTPPPTATTVPISTTSPPTAPTVPISTTPPPTAPFSTTVLVPTSTTPPPTATTVPTSTTPPPTANPAPITRILLKVFNSNDPRDGSKDSHELVLVTKDGCLGYVELSDIPAPGGNKMWDIKIDKFDLGKDIRIDDIAFIYIKERGIDRWGIKTVTLCIRAGSHLEVYSDLEDVNKLIEKHEKHPDRKKLHLTPVQSE